MKLLLDTHIALWAITDDVRLTRRARDLILDSGNDIYFSAVNTWEIAIRHSMGGDVPGTAAEAEADFLLSGYLPLNITPRHTLEVEKLPRLHRDPFDRLLIAQATVEGMQLLTVDSSIEKYPSSCILMVN
ncbi:MAG: type II toxin-antitoxin system VapC family toxin [Janthinobacterium lividum]